MQQLSEIIKNDKSDIISSSIYKFKDLSDSKNGTNIIIELKNGSSPKLVLEELYAKTGLKQSININLNILKNKIPQKYSIIELIREYISHRRNIIKNRAISRNRFLESRLVRLESLIKAIDKIDEVILTIKKSKDSSEACQRLQKLLDINENQSKIVIEIPLRRLTKLEISELNNEKTETNKEINTNKELISNNNNIDKVILEDIKQIKKICGSPRKTQLIEESKTNIDANELINQEELYLMTTFDNKYKIVKHFNNDISDKEKNTILKIEKCLNTNKLLFLNKDGEYVSKFIHEIETTTRNSNGQNSTEIENISEYLIVDDENKYLSTLTEDGKIKRTILSDLPKSNKLLQYIKSKNKTINSIIHRNEEYLIITDKGYAIRYDSNFINPTGRLTQGVKSFSTSAGNPIRLMSVDKDDDRFLMLISSNGLGKKIALKDIQSQSNKGGKGLIVFKISDQTGHLSAATIVNEKSIVLAMTSMGATAQLNSENIVASNRNNKPKSLIDMIMGQTISRIECVL